jgi:hypothetical protein
MYSFHLCDSQRHSGIEYTICAANGVQKLATLSVFFICSKESEWSFCFVQLYFIFNLTCEARGFGHFTGGLI